MSTQSFPAITANNVLCNIMWPSKAFVSPLSGYIQTASREGARWLIRMQFNNLQSDERGVLLGFLNFMQGQVNRIEIGDQSYIAARGALGGTPLVNGADQTGTSLITDGWPNSTLVLKAGDQLSFDNGTNKELKMVTSDATSDGSGNLTISIAPEIHTSPANNAAIETASPVGTFMLVDNKVTWTNSPSQSGGVAAPRSNISVDLIEDIE